MLWLSRPTAADTDTIVECCREPSIGEWTAIPVPYGRADAEHFLAGMVARGWAGRSPTWALRPAERGPVIGMIGLDLPPSDPSAAEIGFWLHPPARGRGLMTRAVQLVCDFGFRPGGLGLQRIQWRAKVGNYASAAVVQRAGFRYEGLLRRAGLQRGSRHDMWIAGRLATDPPGPAAGWPALRS
jgi:RimJ/RimL family protein N-acetyltransferase